MTLDLLVDNRLPLPGPCLLSGLSRRFTGCARFPNAAPPEAQPWLGTLQAR